MGHVDRAGLGRPCLPLLDVYRPPLRQVPPLQGQEEEAMIQLDVLILLGSIPIFAIVIYEHFEKGPR